MQQAIAAAPLPHAAVAGDTYFGKVKSYSAKQGYGFLECPEARLHYNRDVFIHKAQMGELLGRFVGPGTRLDNTSLQIQVQFSVVVNESGFPQARDVVRLDQPESLPDDSQSDCKLPTEAGPEVGSPGRLSEYSNGRQRRQAEWRDGNHRPLAAAKNFPLPKMHPQFRDPMLGDSPSHGGGHLGVPGQVCDRLEGDDHYFGEGPHGTRSNIRHEGIRYTSHVDDCQMDSSPRLSETSSVPQRGVKNRGGKQTGNRRGRGNHSEANVGFQNCDLIEDQPNQWQRGWPPSSPASSSASPNSNCALRRPRMASDCNVGPAGYHQAGCNGEFPSANSMVPHQMCGGMQNQGAPHPQPQQPYTVAAFAPASMQVQCPQHQHCGSFPGDSMTHHHQFQNRPVVTFAAQQFGQQQVMPVAPLQQGGQHMMAVSPQQMPQGFVPQIQMATNMTSMDGFTQQVASQFQQQFPQQQVMQQQQRNDVNFCMQKVNQTPVEMQQNTLYQQHPQHGQMPSIQQVHQAVPSDGSSQGQGQGHCQGHDCPPQSLHPLPVIQAMNMEPPQWQRQQLAMPLAQAPMHLEHQPNGQQMQHVHVMQVNQAPESQSQSPQCQQPIHHPLPVVQAPMYPTFCTPIAVPATDSPHVSF